MKFTISPWFSRLVIGMLLAFQTIEMQGAEARPYVVLYSNENYSGASHRMLPGESLEDVDTLDSILWPAGSAKVGSIEIQGDLVVEFWDAKVFQGNSVSFSQSHPSFDPIYPSNQNWKGRVASVRVYPAQPPASTATPPKANAPAAQTPVRPGPPAGEVRIYADAGFSGDFLTYNRPANEQNLNYVSQSRSGWNDRISSIYIRGDYSVVLFQDANFKGDALRIDESVSNLRDLRRRDPARRNWNDAVSSFEILGKNEESRFAERNQRYAGTLYEDANFQGEYFTLYDGQEIRNLKDEGWNDKVSSIMVERGYKVILWKDSDFRGESITIDLHQPSMHSFPGRWNDQASSLRVVREK